eukprot:scaffold28.g7587.t1
MNRLCLLLLALVLQACLASASVDCYGALVEVQVNVSGASEQQLSVYGYPALFGAPLNASFMTPAPLAWASPDDACAPVGAAPGAGTVGLVARGNCSFSDKARRLQAAGFGAMVLADDSDDCTFMYANASSAEGIDIPAVSITAEAGAELKSLLDGAGGAAAASLRQPPTGGVDWSSAVLWALATGTVVAASAWAGREQAAALAWQQSGAAGRKGGERGEEQLVITGAGAVWFVVIASAMLLLLFFLLSKWVALLLVVLLALGAWQAMAALLLAALARVCPPAWQAAYTPRLPGLDALPVLNLATAVVAGGLCLTWVLCRHALWAWVLQDLLAVCLMLVILRQLLLPNLKVACILLPLAFCYDVWWVFLQPAVTGGESVMVEVATGGEAHEPMPMVLKVPHWPALGTNPAYSILGFGDVVLPGLLAVLARRWDVGAGLGWGAGYAAPAAAGYAAGLALTYVALVLSWFGDEGQPALLYLVPCTLGTVTLLAWRRGHLRALWTCKLDGAGAGEPRQTGGEAAIMEAGAAEERGPLLQS